MIRNISIALLSALMAYLLSSTENNMNAFALVVSALAFTLGYIAANESRKQTERTETAMRSLKESIDTQNEALKSSLTDFGKQTTNAITTLNKNTFDSINKAENNLSAILKEEIKEMIPKVSFTIKSSFDDLKNVVDKLYSSTEELPVKISESLITIEKNLSINYESANKTVCDEIKEIMKGFSDQLCDANNKLSDIARVTINSEGSGSKVEDAIREVKGEISKVASPLNDILDDLKDAINKLQNSADDIPEKIERSLNKIEQNLSVFYETANSEGREEIKKGMDDIRDDFNKAIEDLSEIAVKFTDYEKEKDIIQRLEKLCK